jgi:hypothetical protein
LLVGKVFLLLRIGFSTSQRALMRLLGAGAHASCLATSGARSLLRRANSQSDRLRLGAGSPPCRSAELRSVLRTLSPLLYLQRCWEFK